jgi:hypothetical protein
MIFRTQSFFPCRRATTFGARKGEILSGNASPIPGTDFGSAISIISSYCKADLTFQGGKETSLRKQRNCIIEHKAAENFGFPQLYYVLLFLFDITH